MLRSPLLRPTLLPGLPRAWRGPHTLQLGLDPARAVLLDLADPRAAHLLDLLDGTRSERIALTQAARRGVSVEHARALLDALYAAGFVVELHTLLPATLPADTRHRLTGEAAALAMGTGKRPAHPDLGLGTPAQTLRRRAGARVVLTGRGRLAAAVGVALAQAGIGHVQPDLSGAVTRQELAGGPLRAADVGLPRHEAVTAAVGHAAPGTRTGAVRRGTASLVIQFGHDKPAVLLAAGHARRRQPHLVVSVREGTAIVGPLVPATGAPCLNCLDLHRRERDADWPELSAQLGTGAGEPCGIATALAATAYAVREVLTFIDGAPPETLGAAVEISAAGRFRRRTWAPHPDCRCSPRRRVRVGV